MRAVLFRENAEKLAGMDVEEVMNLIGESQDESTPVNQIRERLLNKELSLVGRAKYNDYSEQLEFIADAVL